MRKIDPLNVGRLCGASTRQLAAPPGHSESPGLGSAPSNIPATPPYLKPLLRRSNAFATASTSIPLPKEPAGQPARCPRERLAKTAAHSRRLSRSVVPRAPATPSPALSSASENQTPFRFAGRDRESAIPSQRGARSGYAKKNRRPPIPPPGVTSIRKTASAPP